MDSPSPVPPSSRERPLSTRKKRSKIRCWSSGGMPIPASRTDTTTSSPSRATPTWTSAPARTSPGGAYGRLISMARAKPAPAAFHPAVQSWFAATFPGPTRAQRLAWPAILSGRSTLVLAPTGSGKTLAAFLAALERLMFTEAPKPAERCRVLYVSPLKALAVDVERNLRAPLAGIARHAELQGVPFERPAVGIRTGDTPARERARMARHPPDILITTPESLFLILTSNARSFLETVEVVIVDEIHSLVGSKRGAHLALSLERLQESARSPQQRIGLSATQRPLEVVARYLGGFEDVDRPRPVEIVNAGAKKAFDIRVEVPVEDMARLGEAGSEPIVEGDASRVARPSIWPAIHPRLLALIREHRSTLLFVNSRRLAERLATALNERSGEELVRAHHGSLAREERLLIEDALKAGRLPALVATSTLELGIDMGAVDLVIQIETPPSVTSGIQRIGRASHQVEAVSRGVIFPKYRGDLLATAAITRAMLDGEVEPTRVPTNPLDVLAQHLVSMAVAGERSVDELYATVQRSAPFVSLPRGHFDGVLDMLAGRYPSDEMAELRPRLVWDRRRGSVRARTGARAVVVANAGTIPDRGLYGVFLAGDEGERGGRRVGELDEEMVFESSVGDVIVLGAASWRILEITRDRVMVAPAPGEPGRLPFWKADRPPRPLELGLSLGRLVRKLLSEPEDAALGRLTEKHLLDRRAARNLMAYLDEQRQATGVVPDDRTLVLERTRDELGDWRLCLLSPWGGRVHAAWALAIEARLRARGEPEVESLWSDDGIVLRLPDRESPPDAGDLLPEPEEIEELVTGVLGGTALFAARFREAAARALLLPRRRPGQRAPLWLQRRRAADLLSVASRHGSFPIILEAYRECLEDHLDLAGLLRLATAVRRRELRLVTVDTTSPSPFSASLLFGYVANYIYDGDAPLAERRAQALSVDPRQLRELLGEAELRELLDAAATEELERGLQCLDEARRARDADTLHDLLRRLGELSLEEIADRLTAAPDETPARRLDRARALVDGLLRERRVFSLMMMTGEERWAAAEDAGRLRDAFGIAPPPGLPGTFLEPAPDALTQVVGRYARTHGPFRAQEVARRFGLGEATVEQALLELVAAGRVVEGEFRPGGTGREWCEASGLTRLRRLSLARLRRQVEPAESRALAALLPAWQGVATREARRADTAEVLLDAIEVLQGAALPASVLESEILPARVPGYRPEHLDALCAAGEVVWVGLSPHGEHDGRLALYLADDLWLLHEPRATRPEGALHETLRRHLRQHGASFFGELQQSAGMRMAAPVLQALWDLVWAGEVTNDTLSPLRALVGGGRRSRRASRRLAAFRSRREVPPTAVGRFSLVERQAARAEVSPTERVTARVGQLLARHGILTREAVTAEEVPGGFAALYPVLRALEDQGRVRRGYFLAGMGGSQFADPGALERLRSLQERPGGDEETSPARPGMVLAATDPANAYGAALPWPRGAAPFSRIPGAHVVLVDGHLAAYVGREEQRLIVVLPEQEPERSGVGRRAAQAIADWFRDTGRRRLAWGEARDLGGLGERLREAGFVPSGNGLRLPAAAGAAPAGDRPGGR